MISNILNKRNQMRNSEKHCEFVEKKIPFNNNFSEASFKSTNVFFDYRR